MKLFAKKNREKKRYPTIKEYNKSAKSKLIATTLSLSLSLSPFIFTSCNRKPNRKIGTMIAPHKTERKIVTKPQKVEEAIKKMKKDKDKDEDKVIKPQKLDGMVAPITPCDDENIKKDDSKKDDSKKDDSKKDDSKIENNKSKPPKLMGRMRRR